MATKSDVLNLASEIATIESEETGQDYTKCISNALDIACRNLKISKEEFIKMFI